MLTVIYERAALPLFDYNILACLKENSRENATAIGAKINLSTSAVIERIKKMENAGLIEQYTTIINQSALGRETTAFISVSLEHPRFNEEFIKLVQENSSIAECHYIAGDFDFILKVITKNGKNHRKKRTPARAEARAGDF